MCASPTSSPITGTRRGTGDLATESTNIPPVSRVSIRECTDPQTANLRMRQEIPGCALGRLALSRLSQQQRLVIRRAQMVR
jgi:hypothetical protein